MKAVVRPRWGKPDVLQLKEVEVPKPEPDQVLVKVCAASLNKADWFELGASFTIRLIGGGLRKPKREMIGSDMAGRVVSVGTDVKRFKPGDEVFGSGLWSYAEYAPAMEQRLAIKPSNTTFEDAATLPIAGITALQSLRDKGKVGPGQKVLINGASGSVGTFAVQIAKSFGGDVTAVCSPANLENAKAIGADHVVDYTKEDFAKNGQSYDLILGVNGGRSVFTYRRSLAPSGKFVLVGGSNPIAQILQVFLLGRLASTGGKKIGFMGIAKMNPDDLAFLGDLLQKGKIKPLIDRRYPLSETADAFRYLGEGHAKGKIVVTIASDQ